MRYRPAPPRGPSDTKRPAPPKTTHVGNTPCPPTCHRSNGSCRSARRRETPPTGIPHARRGSRHVSEPFQRLCRTPPKTPPPRSYRCLERHFPRPCGPPTRVRHPYRPPFVRSSDQQRPNSRRQHRRRTSRAPFPVAAVPRRRNSRRILSGCHTPSEQQILSSRAVAERPQSRRERAPERRKRRKKRRRERLEYPLPPTMRRYQLAFVTPGIRPFEAISRNWIRLMPNRRM